MNRFRNGAGMVVQRSVCALLALPLLTALRAAEPAQDDVRNQLTKELELVDQALTRKPDQVETLLAKGQLLRKLKRTPAAVTVYERVLELAPDHPHAANLLALLYLQAGRVEDCEQACQALGRAWQLSDDLAVRLEYLAALSRCRRTEEAVAHYTNLPADTPLSDEILLEMGACYREAGDPAGAVTVYRRLLARDPGHSKAALGLGLALLDAGQVDDALQTVETALVKEPDRLNLLFAKAAIHWKGGALALALDTFDHIMALSPGSGDAVNLKAQLMAEMGCASLARQLAEAHPGAISAEVREYIERAMAKSRRTWAENRLATNILRRLEPTKVIALAYHDVPAVPTGDPLAVTRASLVQHLEYLRTHDYTLIGAADILAARRLERPLPQGAVALTFNHGYASFHANVLPLLELYEVPAIVGICPEWVDAGPPAEIAAPLMEWDAIREIAGHPQVTLATHGSGLFRSVRCNPQGDTAPAAATRICFSPANTYETDVLFRERVQQALARATQRMKDKIGFAAGVLLWPRGAYNGLAAEEAQAAGFRLLFGLRTTPQATDTRRLERWTVHGPADVLSFIGQLKTEVPAPRAEVRGLQASLDAVYDASPRRLESNLKRFLARVQSLGVNTVYLEAYSDTDHNEAADAVYFPSRTLEVRLDLFDHVAGLLRAQGIHVYACLPVLSFDLPRSPKYERLLVMECHGSTVRPSRAPQFRLSPFAAEARTFVRTVYEELAAHARFDGILFHSDAYLTDKEDFNPAAQEKAAARLGLRRVTPADMTAAQQQAWVQLKTAELDAMVADLRTAVRRHRPHARSIRSVYAPVLHYPASEQWFAQNYAECVRRHDGVMVLAYVEMEDVTLANPWLAGLVKKAAAVPEGLEQTVFMLQSYDWSSGKWVAASKLGDRIRRLAREGAHAIAYGPDDFSTDRPALKPLRRALSARKGER